MCMREDRKGRGDRCISATVICPHEGGYSFSSSQERERFRCPHIYKLNLGCECVCPLLRGSGLGLGIQEQSWGREAEAGRTVLNRSIGRPLTQQFILSRAPVLKLSL